MTRLLPFALLASLVAASGCTTGRGTRDAGRERDGGLDIGFAFEDLGFDAGLVCMRGTIDCGGECVRVAGDDDNCGSCGNVCPTGVHCAAGYCNCDDPLVSCMGVCLDPSDDPLNCGECGYACGPGEMCTAGECLVMCDAPNVICRNPPMPPADAGVGDPDAGVSDPDAGMSGPDAGTRLVPVCADLQTDEQNCGSCNSRCLGGATCTAGRCACPTTSLNCGGLCVDQTSDPANCGSCGISCGTGGTCAGSRCTSCGTDRVDCSGICLDVMTNHYNCGSCGRSCGAGESCVGGLCSCVAPLVDCGAGCTDLTTNRVSCGACGIDCGAGGVCTAGACTCAAGLTMCSGSCRNITNDVLACGACDTPCPALTGGICSAGVCGCPAGLNDCGGTCVNRATDRNNCGACGNVCPGLEVCILGACISNPLYHGWTSPVAGCTTTGYTTTAPTNLGGTYPYNVGDSTICRAWKLAATVCTTQPVGYGYAVPGDWQCPISGGFTDPAFGTYCRAPSTQYACSDCYGACNAACAYNPLSLRNCSGSETAQP